MVPGRARSLSIESITSPVMLTIYGNHVTKTLRGSRTSRIRCIWKQSFAGHNLPFSTRALTHKNSKRPLP